MKFRLICFGENIANEPLEENLVVNESLARYWHINKQERRKNELGRAKKKA